MRRVKVNTTVYSQPEIVLGLSPLVGLTFSDLTASLVFEGRLMPSTLVNGQPFTDNLISSGKLYFQEIGGNPGAYLLRWRPNAIGTWVVSLAASSFGWSDLLTFGVTGEADG